MSLLHPHFQQIAPGTHFCWELQRAFQIPNEIWPIRCVVECALKHLQNTIAASAANLELVESQIALIPNVQWVSDGISCFNKPSRRAYYVRSPAEIALRHISAVPMAVQGCKVVRSLQTTSVGALFTRVIPTIYTERPCDSNLCIPECANLWKSACNFMQRCMSSPYYIHDLV
ncbi:Hypothetical_protein [Hexamita inflata]|nr:Hypothetical protein HINF_LOCUS28990 [Hexamita inflata]CAI9941347.1 Hypothetical protein HINF_LOCUS28992 [Hexamita inflata]CAI9960851.1 Hypothetical protein HINF_LOCUS48496 [Hexamita inflata]CAI9960856.1 Hypothetical protein HINF_LOCUS48501 [Hexamita inflata]CAI9960859.1 Hypothetical protein HINF_LOCUS48504 [Hexamita inflata]